MYESPITLVVDKIQDALRVEVSDDCYKIVQSYGIDVDKAELEKALLYDREQYHKGYIDAIEEVAEKVKDKMMYMCGCANCIETIVRIIKGEYTEPFESKCRDCGLCDEEDNNEKN